MGQLFTLQSQRMDSLEERLEVEARQARNAMHALEGRVSDEAKARTVDNERIEGNTKGMEECLKKLEVKEGGKDDSGAGNMVNAGNGERGGGNVDAATHHTQRMASARGEEYS